MHYQGVDAELHQIPEEFDDPRRVAREMNRRYDPTEATRDYFLVNGRSFPYTVRESQVIVEPGKDYRLRVLNGGSETVSLHTHGHKVTVEAYDGVAVDEGQEITRDVVGLTAAQRLDLTLNTTDDGRNAYGPGVWLMHDHREKAVTNDGISPGGTVSMITYRSYLNANGIPDTNVDLQRYFSEAFYEGKTPMFSTLDRTRFGSVAVATPAGNQSNSSRQPASGASGNDRTTIMGIPVIFLAVGVLGVAFAIQLAVLYSDRRDDQ
jgi:FtsP/CotA-like multicopper oxidase with cupredoxin domain